MDLIMSATTELQLKYQGSEFSRNKQQKTYKETYIGTEQLVDAKIATLSIGSFSSGKGYLSSWRKSQDQSIFYNLQLEYTTQYDNDTSDLSQTDYGKKSAQLSVRNIQMPLQHLPNYKTNWNYYLASLYNQMPPWWQTATDTILSPQDRKQYMWVKSVGEIPTDPDAEGNYWTIVADPTKPGVQYYDLACFVVTETTRHGSASSAGNSIEKKINTITRPSQDFGINGGNWKLDQCTIQYNGGYWLATKTYTRSGDDQGWDTDIYKD